MDSGDTTGDRVVAHVPQPPSERGHWLLAGSVAAIGVVALVAVLTGLIGRSSTTAAAVSPPQVLVVAATPTVDPSAARASVAGVSGSRAASGHGAIIAQPSAAEQHEALTSLVDPLQTEVSARWMEGFYPIYAGAQRTFGVNWLLIASIHKQETAFSTAPSTYHGLNFAALLRRADAVQRHQRAGQHLGSGEHAYRFGVRPAVYDHVTATHPSIYDDFDAIMAAAWLLSADGARYRARRLRVVGGV